MKKSPHIDKVYVLQTSSATEASVMSNMRFCFESHVVDPSPSVYSYPQVNTGWVSILPEDKLARHIFNRAPQAGKGRSWKKQHPSLCTQHSVPGSVYHEFDVPEPTSSGSEDKSDILLITLQITSFNSRASNIHFMGASWRRTDCFVILFSLSTPLLLHEHGSIGKPPSQTEPKSACT